MPSAVHPDQGVDNSPLTPQWPPTRVRYFDEIVEYWTICWHDKRLKSFSYSLSEKKIDDTLKLSKVLTISLMEWASDFGLVVRQT